MRIDIVKEESIEISNLTCNITDSNVVNLRWDWPYLAGWETGVIIFETSEPEESLESLISRGARAKRIPRNGGQSGSHKEPLRESKICFKLFPSNIDNGTELVYEQREGNITPVLYKRIVLERQVRYNFKNIISGFTTACFEFKDREKLMELPSGALQYYKYNKRSKEPVCRYPANTKLLYSGEYTLMVENGYGVDLCCSKEYGGAVVIKDLI